jgi:hypothetical protein
VADDWAIRFVSGAIGSMASCDIAAENFGRTYPSRKSRLEILLDHYFDVECTVSANAEDREFFDEMRRAGVRIQGIHLRPPRPFL